MKSGVLVSGNLVLDELVRPVDRVQWGGTTLVESIERHLGGNGANAAYTIGRLGRRVRLLGAAGRDDAGEFVLDRLRDAGVDLGGVRRPDAPTAASVVIVKSSGERWFLHRPGVSAEVDFTPGELAPEFAAGFAYYHMGSPFGLDRLRPRQPAILRQAREAGLTTSLDTHWDSSGEWLDGLAPCLEFTDLLFVNEDEARMLGGPGALLARGAGSVILKRGGEGCEIHGRGGPLHVPAFPAPVVDTTGAGDCFVGGFLAALDRGASLAEAARLANAVGALSIGRLGAVEGLLPYEETLRWMEGRR